MSESDSSKRFLGGNKIFSEGDIGDTAYIVRQGVVRITHLKNGLPATVALRKPGDIIGEMSILSDARRCATATAETDCVVLALRRPQIEELMTEAHPLLKLLLLTAFERLRENAERANYYQGKLAASTSLEYQPELG